MPGKGGRGSAQAAGSGVPLSSVMAWQMLEKISQSEGIRSL